MPWLHHRGSLLSKRRLLVAAVACTLLITARLCWPQSAAAAIRPLAGDEADGDADADEPPPPPSPRITGEARGFKVSDAEWRRVSGDLISKTPPWAPLDAEALARNFQGLRRVVRRLTGRRRVGELMKLREPGIRTTDWRLHTPKGRLVSVESVQRSLLLGSQGYPVPNAAHFILPFRDPSLQFHHMVSILSCLHVMRPQLLILWYVAGHMTRGKWWSQLRSNLTADEWENRVVMATRPLPEAIYTAPLTSAEHQSDVIRMEALLIFGGAYFDIDVIVLKPLEPLRRFPFVIGRERADGLCNGALLSAPNATFLAMWHTAYQAFDASMWSQHSVQLPHLIQRSFPDLCRVEETSLQKPSWKSEEVALIYGAGRQREWDWRARNFVLHLWFRWYGKRHDMQTIRKLDSMYGEVCRYILFGVTATF